MIKNKILFVSASVVFVLCFVSAFLLYLNGIIRDNYAISGEMSCTVDTGSWICLLFLSLVMMFLYFFHKNYESIMRIKWIGYSIYMVLWAVCFYCVYVGFESIWYYYENGYLVDLIKIL